MTQGRAQDVLRRLLARRGFSTVALVMLLAGGMARTWSVSLSNTGMDYFHFAVAPLAIPAWGAGLYSPQGRAGVAQLAARRVAEEPGEARMAQAAAWFKEPQLTGTPFFYTVFSWFTPTHYESGYREFQAVSLLGGVAAMLWLAWLLGCRLNQALLLALLSVDLFEPWLSDTRAANVNRLLLLGVAGALALHRGRKPWHAAAAGAWLVTCVAFKPVLAGCCVTLLIAGARERHWRALAHQAVGGLAAALVILGITAWKFESLQVWFTWGSQFSQNLPEAGMTVAMGNYGLRRVLEETWASTPATWVCMALCAAALMAPAFFKRPGMDGQDALAMGMGVLAFLLGSRLAWVHYHLLLLPLLFLLLLTTGPVSWLAWLAWLALALNPILSALELQSALVMAQVFAGGTALLGLAAAHLGVAWHTHAHNASDA